LQRIPCDPGKSAISKSGIRFCRTNAFVCPEIVKAECERRLTKACTHEIHEQRLADMWSVGGMLTDKFEAIASALKRQNN